MKTYRVLGILWLVFCSHSIYLLIRSSAPVFRAVRTRWLPLLFLLFFVAVDLLGIVGSIFLFRGATWARWLIAGVAIFELLSGLVYFVTARPWFTVLNGIYCAFALVSLVLLLLPRRERVA